LSLLITILHNIFNNNFIFFYLLPYDGHFFKRENSFIQNLQFKEDFRLLQTPVHEARMKPATAKLQVRTIATQPAVGIIFIIFHEKIV